MSTPAPQARKAFSFGPGEWAGACGDLGTLLPYLVAYLVVLKLAPAGVLCGFGLALLSTALWFRTPLPVQPMKAIGALAVAQGATAEVIFAAGLLTGMAWLLLGASGWARRLARLVTAPVTGGLVLGLAISLMGQAGGLMLQQPGVAMLALVALSPTLLAARWPRSRAWRALALAAPIGLLLAGVGWLTWTTPLAEANLQVVLPAWALPTWTWPGLASGELLWAGFLLALPQLPLTLGNALLAVRAEHARLLPERPAPGETPLALSTGGINVLGSAIGAVPMCHGVGGLAAQVHFGARSGGAPLVLGLVLLLAGLGWAEVSGVVLQQLPPAVPGALLALAAWALARGQLQAWARQPQKDLLLVVALLSLWSAAAALAVGLLLQRWWRTPPSAAP